MIVKNIRMWEGKNDCRLIATVSCGTLSTATNFDLWYAFPKEYKQFISLTGNPFIAALLLPSMSMCEPLIIDGPISPQLYSASSKIMDIFHSWDKSFKKIKIKAEDCVNVMDPIANASFFSGGVDSFYTILKNAELHQNDADSISHLILIHGFDIPLNNEEMFNKVFKNIYKIGERLGKKVITVKTNLRDVTKAYVKWGIYHGGALVSIALGLEKLLKKVYIASADSYAQLIPTGLTPYLDPLWSTENLIFEHDGAEATRLEKIQNKIIKSPVALENLRVCWKNVAQKFNCCECEKCLRTMISLSLLGVLEKCSTFNKPISLEKVRNLEIDDSTAMFFKENLELARTLKDDSAMLLSIKTCLRKNGYYKRFENLKTFLKKIDENVAAGSLKNIYRLLR